VEGFAVWWRDWPKTTPDPCPLLTPFAMHFVGWLYGVRSRFRVGVCGVVARLPENDSRPLSSPDPVRHACRCLGYGVRSRFRGGVCGVVARLPENDSRPLSSPDPVRHACRCLALRGQESFSWRGLRCGGAEDRGRESFSGGDSPTVKTLKRKRLLTPFAMHVVAWVTGSGVVFVEGFAVWWRDWPKTTPDPCPLLTPFAMHFVGWRYGVRSRFRGGLRCGGAIGRKRLPTPVLS
jgi:hypothetical protein